MPGAVTESGLPACFTFLYPLSVLVYISHNMAVSLIVIILCCLEKSCFFNATLAITHCILNKRCSKLYCRS
jgi:hypothetical protein